MKKKPDNIEYGKFLRALRLRMGKDQSEFARAIGVSTSTLLKVETGFQALGKAGKAAVELLNGNYAQINGQENNPGLKTASAERKQKAVEKLIMSDDRIPSEAKICIYQRLQEIWDS